MELKVYLRTLIRKGWIVLITFTITYAATLILTFTQTPVYRARSTYVLKLNASIGNDKELASAVDILSRRTEIATTYTTVANSRLIRKLAADELGLTPEQRQELSVSSELVAGTNVLEITADAYHPELARDFATAIGIKTVAYSQDLYEAYKLEPLDQANLPDTPIKPNKPLNLVLGAVMGLVLGMGLAFLSAYLQDAPEHTANMGIIDDTTGAYNLYYFKLRLKQELNRARHNGYALSIALMDIDHGRVLQGSTAELRNEIAHRVVVRLKHMLRDEDIIAHFDNTVFAFLLPDISGDVAKDMMERLRMIIAETSFDMIERHNLRIDLQASVGIIVCSDPQSNVTSDELLDQGVQALKRAEAATYGAVSLLSEKTTPAVDFPLPKMPIGKHRSS
jgi:diguanylate cyclase (GGDEF)-like protein